MPAAVRIISVPYLRVATGGGIESSPPVRETTFNLPGILRPLLSRSTAGVGSAKCTLVARKRGCDGGRDFIPAPHIQIQVTKLEITRFKRCRIKYLPREPATGDYGRA